MTITRFSSALSLKSLDGSGRFAGYASVFDNIDSQNDIVMRGAFEKTLATRKNDIKLLWQHQMGEPIGVINRMFEDQHGLFVEGSLLLSVSRAREAYALLKSGAVSGMSIGYTPLRYQVDPDSGVRRIKEAELWEVSLVTFPANQQAQVTVVKAREVYAGIQQTAPDDWMTAKKSGQLIALHDALTRARQLLR